MPDVCVGSDATIRETVQLMDVNCLGVAFVTDGQRLVGVVSDGDFRRAMLRGLTDLDDPVVSIMNSEPATLPVGAGAEETFAALVSGLDEGKRVFPRVDSDGYIRDFSYREHWGLLPVAEPQLTGSEVAYVLQCLEQNWISSTGPFVRQFEETFATFTGLQNPVAVSNGTVAIALALQALGIEPGDEVIIPSSTFAATANAVVAAGGVPVLADVNEISWGLSAANVKPLITPRTRGIIAVHLYGSPCDVSGLKETADDHELFLVEDCAEAIGTSLAGDHVGSMSDAATFSFFGNKTLTTGEGGMVFFADPEAESRARVLRDHGMSVSRRYWHEVVGFNYRMTNVQAAIGVAQVERATTLVSQKRLLGAKYEAGIDNIEHVTSMPTSPFGTTSYWLVPVLLDSALAGHRDMLMELMAAEGIQTRETFPSLHRMPAFSDFPSASEFPNADMIAERGLCLPNTPRMTEESVEFILRVLEENVKKISALVERGSL